MKIDDPNSICFKVDFYSAIIREILNDCVVNSHISALILSMCCIDYIGIPLSGNTKNTKKEFKLFLNNFMSFANQKYGQSDIQDIIYAIRCSLVHTFGESDAMDKVNIKPCFEYGNGLDKEHLNIYNGKEFHLSISNFVSEVIAGVEKYFRENNDHSLFEEWYKKIIIISGYASPMIKLTCVKNNTIVYKNIHEVISILDDNPNIGLKDFAENINKRLLCIYNKISV